MSHFPITPFLEALRATGNVAESCRRVGVSTALVYQHRKSDADFDNAWALALEDATDTLEAAARQWALEGVPEPVIYQGQLTPVWEYDANGEIVMDEYDTGVQKDGQPVMGKRPRQARNADGSPKWLTVRKRDAGLLKFLLTGLRPKYGTQRTEITGKDGAPLAMIDETKRAARLAALLELAKTRKDDLSDIA